jgi:hypothetical protein
MLINYSEPGNPLDVADSVEVTPGQLPFPPFIPYYDIDFSAYLNAGDPCAGFLNGCIGPATGSPQTAFTLDWFSGVGAVVSTDTINVESGTVPEPSGDPLVAGSIGTLGKRCQTTQVRCLGNLLSASRRSHSCPQNLLFRIGLIAAAYFVLATIGMYSVILFVERAHARIRHEHRLGHKTVPPAASHCPLNVLA